MIRFFRTLRRHLLSENRFGKYLLYASGEILLVVIGIVIALQINGWYGQRIERERIAAYYAELSAEFEGIGNEIQNFQVKNDSIISELDTLLHLIDVKPEGYETGIQARIPMLYEVPDIHVVTLIIDEFADSGLFSKLSMDARALIIYLILDIEEINRQDEWAKQQQLLNIEPFLLKHVDYKITDHKQASDDGDSSETKMPIADLSNHQMFKNIITMKRNIQDRSRVSLSKYTRDLAKYREFLQEN